jgi:hypothetical protein
VRSAKMVAKRGYCTNVIFADVINSLDSTKGTKKKLTERSIHKIIATSFLSF